MIEKLQILTNKLIQANKNDEKNLQKFKLIEKILSDKHCFLKIDIEYAFAILRDLGIKEENLKNIYKELIDIKNN